MFEVSFLRDLLRYVSYSLYLAQEIVLLIEMNGERDERSARKEG